MSEFQLCACGSAPGYPHRPDCPRPLYNPSDAQFEAWEKDWLNMKTQHTPTPWKPIKDMVYNADGTVAKCAGDTDLEAYANAEFIVRACNAHDELLAALRLVEKALSLEETMGGHVVQSHRNTIRDAIARATKS